MIGAGAVTMIGGGAVTTTGGGGGVRSPQPASSPATRVRLTAAIFCKRKAVFKFLYG
jgi:hypothetical protein